MMVAVSWVINPLANFFLLFDRDGKYALSYNEKWNAISFSTAIVIGLLAMIAAWLIIKDSPSKQEMLIAALVVMSVSIPLGHMRFPWTFQGNSFLQWYSMSLVLTALVVALITLILPESNSVLLIVYIVGFAAYMWLHAFSKR
jgi:hypothetical protein